MTSDNLFIPLEEEPNNKFNSFFDYLYSVLTLYRNSIPVAKEKFNAISNDNLEALNRTIQIQQAFLLKTRSFDTGLAEHLRALEISEATLSGVILKLPKEEQGRFFSLLGELEYTLKEIQYYNEKSQALLNTKLYMIDRQLAKLENNAESMVYSHNAREIQKSKSNTSFQTKI